MEITTFFRKIIIVFMLLIVSFSVLFAILKPTNNGNSAQDTNKDSHAGKLIFKEETQQTRTKTDKPIEEDFSNPIEQIQSTVQTRKEKARELIDNFFQTKEISNKPQKIIQNEEQIQLPEPTGEFKDIQRELSEKYNNDPNAEVSEEDIIKYMNKAIEALPQE